MRFYNPAFANNNDLPQIQFGVPISSQSNETESKSNKEQDKSVECKQM